jgi:hypothetical protein
MKTTSTMRWYHQLKLTGAALFLLLGLVLTGCATQTAMITVPPTCAQAVGERYHDLTDYEIARLLGQAADEDCRSCLVDCWIPLMQRCLDDGRDLPHEEIVKAVKVFNQQQYRKYFDLAVYRYFYDLSRGIGSYRSVDRKLLHNYCAMLVHNAKTRSNPRLAQAMELCQRLDPQLYDKMFR